MINSKKETLTHVTDSTRNTNTSSLSSRTGGREVSNEQWNKFEEAAVSKAVSTCLWNKAKFIYNDADLDYDGKIASIIFGEMKIAEEIKEEWWEWAKSKVKKNLNQKRNAVCTSIKKWIVGKKGQNEKHKRC